jgi:hypothetical protein
MSCCGQKREAVAAARTGAAETAYRQTMRPARAIPAPAGGDVTVLCRDRGATTVEGPVTGIRYQFAGAGSMQAVDRRDAEMLVATGAFARVWG